MSVNTPRIELSFMSVSPAMMEHRIVKLREATKVLPPSTPDYVRVDVEIYLKAAEWAVRHNDFFDGGKAAVAVLEQGLQRVKDAIESKPSWLLTPGKVVSRA